MFIQGLKVIINPSSIYRERYKMKICLVSVNFANSDNDQAYLNHTSQIIHKNWELDYYHHTNDNTTLRSTVNSRVQSRMHKMHMHELHPGYDLYMWIDGSFVIKSDAYVSWMVSNLGNHDICMYRHPHRKNVKEEVEYVTSWIQKGSTYLIDRYSGEPLKEQYAKYINDAGFKDTFLISSGSFIYRYSDKIATMMRDWFYNISRWSVLDQLSLPYVLQKNKIDVKILEENLLDNPLIKHDSTHGKKSKK